MPWRGTALNERDVDPIALASEIMNPAGAERAIDTLRDARRGAVRQRTSERAVFPLVAKSWDAIRKLPVSNRRLTGKTFSRAVFSRAVGPAATAARG